MFLITLIVFIVIFSALVLVHEWGHFAAARKAGMKVEEFGIGLPPRAKGLFKDKKGTLYSLNWIPFGGFVRLYGEDVSDPKVLKDPQSYASKPVLSRIAVVVAGVAMNFLLAWVLISIGFMIGMKPFLVTEKDVQGAVEQGIVATEPAVYVNEVAEDSSLAGMEGVTGSVIVAIDGEKIATAEDLISRLAPDQTVKLTLVSNEEKLEVEASTNAEGKLGVTLSDQLLLGEIQKVQYPFYQAPVMAAKEVVRLSGLTVYMLKDVVVQIVQKFTVPEGVAGPVGIFKMTGQMVKQGFADILQFTALLSVSLGVINIMPFPALDGGRLLFILVEVITRRKPSPKLESVVHGIGFIFLMGLILLITWNDIFRSF